MVSKRVSPYTVGVMYFRTDDSVAYCAAYQKFCIAQKVARDMKKSGMDLGEEPLEFGAFWFMDENYAINKNRKDDGFQ